jgi:hypothetical protein
MIRLRKLFFGILMVVAVLTGRTQTSLSSAMLKPMRGPVGSFESFTKKDSLILVCFWSINSEETTNELNAINAHFENWKQSVKFKLMAVSVDEGKLVNRVRPTAIMNGWTFEVFVDTNGDLRKALGSNNLPQSFIIKNGRVVYQQSGYDAGTENYLFQKIVQFSNGK